MKKIYHPYWLWEDFIAGMWGTSSNKSDDLARAIEFTGNADLYGEWMMNVVNQWPISCEQNLTDSGINQKAWIGHAACCMAIGCPEYITRKAWGFLSYEQQDSANDKAQQAIRYWNEKQSEKVYSAMGIKVLSVRNTRRSAGDFRAIGKGSIIQANLSRNIEERFSINQLGLF